MRFKVLEVVVKVHWSVLITLIVYPIYWYNFPIGSPVQAVALGFLIVTMVYLSIFVHEFSHVKMAESLGFHTTHISLWLLGGLAHVNFNTANATTTKSTPESEVQLLTPDEVGHVPGSTSNEGGRSQDTERTSGGGEKEHTPVKLTPSALFKISAIGPLTSFFLSGTFLSLYIATDKSWFTASVIFLALAVINMTIGLFNLLPGLPLDGGNIVKSFVWFLTKNEKKGNDFASLLGKILAVSLPGVFTWWRLKYADDLGVLTTTIGILLSFALGLFLWVGATQSEQQKLTS